ncbi:MAG TPA: hypothetical protein VD902_12745, partial [Symbiobacteriaceae bacterium]|nr:hypothetical protein [Symbiobacteriaceae bacterium]
MGGVLSNYTVMQQNEWAGRRFYTAQDRRTGQVVHLVAESVRGRSEPYGHASLPPLQLLAVEGDERWLIGALTEGDTLEDLRHRGGMTETDLVSGLLSIIDGLAALSALEPPPVPSYLDPACVKRDRLGRWTLDFLALAHAPEARSQASPPLGVYAFGVLLYWLATGQLVRRTRVQVDRIEEGLPAALQFIVIRCLGRNYPSLAELRADIERAGRDHEFRSMLPARKADLPLATRLPVIPPGGEAGADPPGQAGYQRVPLGGPHIPMNDRPWALPPRPEEGFRKYMV